LRSDKKILTDIKTIAVIGSGTMGQGIAQVLAAGGYKTLLFDANPAMPVSAKANIEKGLDALIQKGKLSEGVKASTVANIYPIQNKNELVADLLIEAIVENLAIKQNLFQSLETINSVDSIFCTNTSSLSVSNIFASCKKQDRCLGVHFFNPAQVMKLVELISGEKTSLEIVQQVASMLKALGKITVQSKDSPGFIVNRVARHYYLESLKLLEEGSATAEEIDALLRATGFKMGAFELMDLIGVDVNLAVSTAVYNGFNQNSKYKPNDIQIKLVQDGKRGRKNGKGFYEYPKA
jgi:3-hydroxybutyryl-CoA dehydrogenase